MRSNIHGKATKGLDILEVAAELPQRFLGDVLAGLSDLATERGA